MGGGSLLARAWRLLRPSRATRRDDPVAMDALLQCVPTIFWTAGADGRIDHLSDRFAECTGMASDEAVRGDRWKHLVHPEDMPSMEAQWACARTTGSEMRCYFRLRWRDGAYRWMQSAGRPVLYGTDGGVLRWAGGLSDVDEALRARHSVQDVSRDLHGRAAAEQIEVARMRWRYRSLFHEPTIGVIELDLTAVWAKLERLRAAGVTALPAHLDARPELVTELVGAARTVEVNPAMVTMLGFTDGGAYLLNNPPSRNRITARGPLRRMVEALFAGEHRVTGTAELTRADGSRLVVTYTVNLSEDHTAYSTLVDITAQHDAAELRLAMQEQLARVSKASTVDALSISIAHELNQPLTSMRIELAALARQAQAQDRPAAALQPGVERLVRQCARLAAIVERTRDRVLAHPRERNRVSLSEVVRQLPSLLEHELAAHQVRLHLTAPEGLIVSADAHDLQQLFVNLAMNAMEAMAATPPADRALWIDLVRQGERVRVRVADSGPGIDPALWPMIFEPFFTTKPEGLGMGLRICRTIVETMGGDLQACRREGGGALFEFCVPLVLEG